MLFGILRYDSREYLQGRIVWGMQGSQFLGPKASGEWTGLVSARHAGTGSSRTCRPRLEQVTTAPIAPAANSCPSLPGNRRSHHRPPSPTPPALFDCSSSSTHIIHCHHEDGHSPRRGRAGLTRRCRRPQDEAPEGASVRAAGESLVSQPCDGDIV